MAGVIFSDPDPVPVPKFLNPDPGPKFFQIWESDFYSNSGHHRFNPNSTMLVLKQWHLRDIKTMQTDSCYCRKWKVTPDLGPGFLANIWLRLRVRKINPGSWRSRLRRSGSVATSGNYVPEKQQRTQVWAVTLLQGRPQLLCQFKGLRLSCLDILRSACFSTMTRATKCLT